MSPGYKSLPTTPQSSGDTKGSLPQSDSDVEKQTNENEDSEGQQFVLAPTPAQLGRAPLQRRKNMCMYILNPLKFEIVFNHTNLY